MWFGKVLRPPSIGATLASVDLSGRGDAGRGRRPRRRFRRRGRAQRSCRPHVRWRRSRRNGSPVRQISGKDLFDDLKQQGRPRQREGRGNGAARRSGLDRRTGLDAADVRLEQTYTIAYIAHAPLEPRAAVARWDDGKLTVWTGTQRPFGVRERARPRRSGSPTTRVRVIVPDTGAGYGGKHTGEAAVEAARLAREAGKPVKLVWTREEEFTWAYFRPAGVIEINSGVKRDGTLTAWEFHNYNSGGSGIRTPLRSAQSAVAVSPGRIRRCGRARIAAWPPRPTTSPASRTWTSSRTAVQSTRWNSA